MTVEWNIVLSYVGAGAIFNKKPEIYPGVECGLINWSYVKPINPEKTNRNNNGGSVGKSYSHVHEGCGRVTPGQCS